MHPQAKPARLPELTLPSVPDGSATSVRARGREGTVLLLMHSPTCTGCLDYLDGLAGARDQLHDWDGRVVAVVPSTVEEAAEALAERTTHFPVLADAHGRCYERCGLGGGSILIADQWGEIFFVHEGSPEVHEFPAVSEVIEWLRFVAIQCPECQGEAW